MNDKVERALPAPLAVSVETVTHLLPLGRTKIYELIKKRELRTISCGRRRMIPISEIQAWIERSLLESDAEAAHRSQGGEA